MTKLFPLLALILLLGARADKREWVELKIKTVDCCDRPLPNVYVSLWYLEGNLKETLRCTNLSDRDGLVVIQTLTGKMKLTAMAVCTKFKSKTITLSNDTLIVMEQK